MKKWWMFLIVIIVVILILLFATLSRESTQTVEDRNLKPLQGKIGEVINKETEAPIDSPIEAPVEAPIKGVAIFYRTSMNDVEDRLPVLVEDVNTGEGYATNIRWESHENGIVKYIL